MNGLLSVIIPSRNEPYLRKTVLDILAKATRDIEIIVVLDGWWPEPEELVNDKRVVYIHFSEPKGMRGAINAGVSISKGEYIMKLDAHCMVGEGFDEALKANCEYDWVIVPRRLALEPHTWAVEDNPKYPVDYMYLDNQLHGQAWTEKNKDEKLKGVKIDDVMSGQGSCWFVKRSYFDWLELLDENHYGQFSSEFQEIGFKCWLSGGRVKVNKNTWYAHFHKTESRGYSLSKGEFEKGNSYAEQWRNKRMWRKQRHDLKWLIDKFSPVPTWGEKI